MATRARSPISAAVFDLGNVLVGWNPYRPLADRLSPAEWKDFVHRAGFQALNSLADHGVPIDEVIRRAAERDPGDADILRHYYTNFSASLTGPIDGVADIVRELKEEGLRVFGLTNWSAQTYHWAPQCAPIISELEAVVVSGQEGIAKPDPRIFLRLTDAHRLTAEHTVFVDDTELNVEAARALGFVGLPFTDAAALRRDLQRLGALP